MVNLSGKYLYIILIAAIMCVIIFLFIESLPVRDDFNDGSINPSFWNTVTVGAGPSVYETNQRLEIFLPSTSIDTGNGAFLAGVVSAFKLRGDFDVQTDFYLLDWPYSNGVRSALSMRSDPVSMRSYAIERTSFSDYNDPYEQEVYLTDFGFPTGTVTTSDSSGKLRIVRFGSHWSTYYFRDGKWKLDYQDLNGNTEDVHIFLGAWCDNNRFINKNVRLAFDNLLINNGKIIPMDQ